jgi:RNA polymerase sigma-70 factor (ECF subfamily)
MTPNPETVELLQRSEALTDEALVARVLAGDLASFEVLMRRHNARVYRVARSLVRDEAEVEDVMQQAYLAAFAHLREFRGEASFSTWLLRIAHHEAAARSRHALRAVAIGPANDEREDGLAMPDDSRRPDELAETHELTRLAERAIDALPGALRPALVLRDVQGLSTAETAQVLGVSEDVVKQRLHRAREAVRAQMLTRLDERLPEAFELKAPRCDRVVAFVLAALVRE